MWSVSVSDETTRIGAPRVLFSENARFGIVLIDEHHVFSMLYERLTWFMLFIDTQYLQGLLSAHFHPSVVTFATTILRGNY